jgi:hypothetical protein
VVTAKAGHFAFSAGRSVVQRKTWRQDRFRATIATWGGPGASPGLSCFVMTSERISSRAGNHRLDEPRQIIPQHGCVPGAPASVALFSYALRYFNEGTLSPFPAEAGHGWLIQTSVGTAACFGAWRTKRSG